jgi:hypothetical protein
MERNDMGNGAEVGGVRPHCLDAALPYAKPRFSVILLGGFDAPCLGAARQSGSPLARARGITA